MAECVTEPARELTEYVWRDVINLAPMCLHPDAMARVLTAIARPLAEVIADLKRAS